MPVLGKLLRFRADWVELASALGFRTWTSRTPCPFCSCTQDNMHVYSTDERGVPWRVRTHADLLQEMQRCTVHVSVSHEKAAQLQAALFVDDREAGLQGRGLREAVPDVQAHGHTGALDLQPGDRLEVGGSCTDAHEDVSRLRNADLHFFRTSVATFLSHVSPLFMHITLEGVDLDVMHTVDLGVAQYVAGVAFAQILLADGYDTRARVRGALLSRGIVRMRDRLRAWYGQHPEFTRIDRLTLFAAIGPNINNPVVHAKAAESRGLLHFAAEEMRRSRVADTSDAAQYSARAAEHVVEFYAMIKGAGPALPPGAAERLMEVVVGCNTLFVRAGGRLRPKFHLWWHLCARMRASGNAAYYSTYPDETFNGVLKRAAAQRKGAAFTVGLLKAILPLVLCREHGLMNPIGAKRPRRAYARTAAAPARGPRPAPAASCARPPSAPGGLPRRAAGGWGRLRGGPTAADAAAALRARDAARRAPRHGG